MIIQKVSWTPGGKDLLKTHSSTPKTSFSDQGKDSVSARDTFVKNNDIRDNLTFGYGFDLKKVKDVPCAYCGEDAVSTADIQSLSKLKGNALANKLSEYLEEGHSVLNKIDKAAIERIIEIAQDNPDKTGRQLLPVIFVDARKHLIIKQQGVFFRVEKLASSIDSAPLKSFIQEVKSQDKILEPNISLSELSDFLLREQQIKYRKEIVETVLQLKKESGKKKAQNEKWGQVIEEIGKLPSSKNDEDAYLVKYVAKAIKKNIRSENDDIIYELTESPDIFYARILSPILSSAEHVKPYSDEGVCSASNYLLTHSYCNHLRGNEPWAKYMIKHPEKLDKVVENLAYVNDKILHKNYDTKYPDLKNYIPYIINTLKLEIEEYINMDIFKRFNSSLNQILEEYEAMRGPTKLPPRAKPPENKTDAFGTQNLGVLFSPAPPPSKADPSKMVFHSFKEFGQYYRTL
jgi:chorismate mutase